MSTFSTAATRRALMNPSMVSTAVSSSAISALRSRKRARPSPIWPCPAIASGVTAAAVDHNSRTRSRSTVSTSSDENTPMQKNPPQASRSARGSGMRRASMPSGMSTVEAVSSSAPATMALLSQGNAGSRRRPM